MGVLLGPKEVAVLLPVKVEGEPLERGEPVFEPELVLAGVERGEEDLLLYGPGA